MTLRAILWVAVSSKGQATENKISLTEQEQSERAWATAQDIQIVDILSVPGHSRSESDIITAFEEFAAENCFAYHKLREHWKKHDFDLLIAYDNSRLARSMTLFSYVVENTINSGARIYLIIGGWLDEANVDLQIALGGISATAGLKRFVKMTKAAMLGRMNAGLNITQLPPTHRIIYNEDGEPVRLEIREDRRRQFEDAATLLLDGQGWTLLADNMLKVFGHINPNTNTPYPPTYYFRLFHSPFTWGATAYGYRKKHGLWAFDETEPIPDGVSINRAPDPPVPPLWTGEKALAIQAELRRRNKAIHGHASPYRTYTFTGLFLCDGCNRIMTIGRGSPGTIFWGCKSRRQGKYSPVKCDQKKRIRNDIAVEQLKRFFNRMTAMKLTDVADMVTSARKYVDNARIESLKQETAQLEQEIDVMIIEQAKAPVSIRERYQRLINEAAERQEAIDKLLKDAIAEQDSISEAQSRVLAFREMMSMGDKFWQLKTREINQMLHRVMGKIRFVVRDGRITGVRKYP